LNARGIRAALRRRRTDFGLRQEYLWTLDRLRELDMPWLTVIGNHDALSNGTEIYRKMFGPYDYAFDWGGVRFVCFNSNHLERGGDVPNWEFVEAEAIAAEDGGIVLLTHVPPRALEASDQPRFARVLAQPGMLFSAHGHHHAPSHEWLAGVPAVTVGTSEGLHHVVATIDGSRAELELCSDRTCKPLEPEP
jgi:calcineurin-like phosphoesterase family protein